MAPAVSQNAGGTAGNDFALTCVRIIHPKPRTVRIFGLLYRKTSSKRRYAPSTAFAWYSFSPSSPRAYDNKPTGNPPFNDMAVFYHIFRKMSMRLRCKGDDDLCLLTVWLFFRKSVWDARLAEGEKTRPRVIGGVSLLTKDLEWRILSSLSFFLYGNVV